MIAVLNAETGEGEWFGSVEEASNACNKRNGALYEQGEAPRWDMYPPDKIPDWAKIEKVH